MHELPNENELARLPLRGIVAYAARCAARVRSLVPEDAGPACDQALAMSTKFCMSTVAADEGARIVAEADALAEAAQRSADEADEADAFGLRAAAHATAAIAACAEATLQAAHGHVRGAALGAVNAAGCAAYADDPEAYSLARSGAADSTPAVDDFAAYFEFLLRSCEGQSGLGEAIDVAER